METETFPIHPLVEQRYYEVKPMPDDFHLYKYGERKYLEPLLKEGIVSLAIATKYQDAKLTVGQQDNETKRSYALDPEKHSIVVGEPVVPLKNVFNINLSYNLKGRDGNPAKFYIWCASKEYSPEAAGDFPADCCLKIRNFKEFAKRLEAEVRRNHPTPPDGVPGCDFYGRDVIYHDSKELPPTTQQIGLVFLKDREKYEHQKEFRIFFAIDPLKSTEERINFRIGSIEDIAEIVDLP